MVSAQWSTPLVPSSYWATPPADPPHDNVAAPINVSINAQRKSGSLLLGTSATLLYPPTIILDVLGLASSTSFFTEYLLVSKGFSLVDGTQGAGKVLTSDGSGIASWQTSAAATGGATGGTIAAPSGSLCGMYSRTYNTASSIWVEHSSPIKCQAVDWVGSQYLRTVSCPTGYAYVVYQPRNANNGNVESGSCVKN